MILSITILLHTFYQKSIVLDLTIIITQVIKRLKTINIFTKIIIVLNQVLKK